MKGLFFAPTGHHVFAFGWFGGACVSVSALRRISRWQSSHWASWKGMTDEMDPKNPWDVMGCQVATCFEAP